MNTNITVSIIVPIYKIKSSYLKRCIESILKQTYSGLEIILVDDGSPDQCGVICDGYAKKDSRITVIHQKNSGVSVARNAGLEIARGKWVCFIDPDDYVMPNFIDSLLSRTDDITDIIAAGCTVQENEKETQLTFFETDSVFGRDNNRTSHFQFRDKNALLLELMDANYGAKGPRPTAIGVPWGKLYRKDFLDRNDLKFDPELVRMQDNIFNMYAFDAAEKMIYVNDFDYVYTLEHIKNYDHSFNPRIAMVFAQIPKIRFDYLIKFGKINDMTIYETYCRETQKIAYWILMKYILNAENHEDSRVKIDRMRRTFETASFVSGFKKNGNTRISKNANVMIFMLRKRWYHVLLCYANLYNKLKRYKDIKKG